MFWCHVFSMLVTVTDLCYAADLKYAVLSFCFIVTPSADAFTGRPGGRGLSMQGGKVVLLVETTTKTLSTLLL
jgi:hypothetical protein